MNQDSFANNQQSYTLQPPEQHPKVIAVAAEPEGVKILGRGERVSDAHRDRVIRHLNEQHVQGFIRADERNARVQLAFHCDRFVLGGAGAFVGLLIGFAGNTLGGHSALATSLNITSGLVGFVIAVVIILLAIFDLG